MCMQQNLKTPCNGNAISISKESKKHYLPDPSCPQEMPEDPYPYFPLRISQENPRLGAV